MDRKFLAGYVTGGRLFGYDNVKVNGHTEQRINDAEARVVRRIFELADSGYELEDHPTTSSVDARCTTISVGKFAFQVLAMRLPDACINC